MSGKIFTEKEIQIIKENYIIKSDEEISIILNRSVSSVRSKRQKLNLYAHRLPYWRKIRGLWDKMIGRCYDKNNKKYRFYGKVGVQICDEWLNSYATFYIWAIKNYQPGLELDRINTYGNYEPDNCRWITHKENCNNRRPQKKSINKKSSKYIGITKRKTCWEVSTKFNGKRVYIGYYKDEKEAALAYNKFVIENNMENIRALNNIEE